MKQDSQINANEFLKLLKDENLVIVYKGDLKLNERIKEENLKALQQKYLKEDSLTIKQVMDSKLTHYTVYHGLRKSTYIKPGELFKDADGVYRISVKAIKRIREIKNLEI